MFVTLIPTAKTTSVSAIHGGINVFSMYVRRDENKKSSMQGQMDRYIQFGRSFSEFGQLTR